MADQIERCTWRLARSTTSTIKLLMHIHCTSTTPRTRREINNADGNTALQRHAGCSRVFHFTRHSPLLQATCNSCSGPRMLLRYQRGPDAAGCTNCLQEPSEFQILAPNNDVMEQNTMSLYSLAAGSISLWDVYMGKKRFEVTELMKLQQLEAWMCDATIHQKSNCKSELANLREEKDREQQFFESQLEFKRPSDISTDGEQVLLIESNGGYALLDRAFVEHVSSNARSPKELFWRLAHHHFTLEALMNGNLDGAYGFYKLNPSMIDAFSRVINSVARSLRDGDVRKVIFTSESNSRQSFKDALRRLRQRIREGHMVKLRESRY